MHFAAISLVVTAAAAVAAALADVCYDATSEETSLVQRLHKGGKARSNATSKMNDIPCDLMRDTCSTSFPEAADSEEDCQLDTAKADAVCKVRGVADECADAFTTIEVGCTQAVKAGQSFGSQQCRDVVGCDCKFRGVADGGKCHPRSKCCQNPGAVCGMYQNKFPRFQCCSSYAFVDGDFWCQNGVAEHVQMETITIAQVAQFAVGIPATRRISNAVRVTKSLVVLRGVQIPREPSAPMA
eukprot:TRINITY_DN3889_c0_g1_i1.p1 TRINITY_DN3889_c0_g1~~TRINITY_DN3889_c0_g1_i1.p1  ORF type:complete len:241 (+),score=33.81 TRINITY_DN3889_c0_g1_i1:161-883(+)